MPLSRRCSDSAAAVDEGAAVRARVALGAFPQWRAVEKRDHMVIAEPDRVMIRAGPWARWERFGVALPAMALMFGHWLTFV